MYANYLKQENFEFRREVLQTRQTILLGKLLDSLHLFTEIHDTVKRCRKDAASLHSKWYADTQFSKFSVKLRDHPLMCYQSRRNWPTREC